MAFPALKKNEQMAIDAQLQSELNGVINALRKLAPTVRKAGKADLNEAAKLLESAVKGRTPVGEKAHRRYSAQKGRKAGKGSGRPIATYAPGNLRKSMQRLNFRRSSAAFVGPQLRKETPDGYYAHMVERGTTTQRAQYFMRAAVQAAGPQTLRTATELIKRRIASFGKNNGLL